MSPEFVKYFKVLILLLGIPTILIVGWRISLLFFSNAVIVEPTAEQKNVTSPFDIVVFHRGCGLIETNADNNLNAFLINEKGEKEAITLTRELIKDDVNAYVESWAA